MIRENQRLLNRLNVISDGIIIYLMLPLAYWLRFYGLPETGLLPYGVETVPLVDYLRTGILVTLVQLFTYAGFGIYQTTRVSRLRQQAARLLRAGLLDLLIFLGWLFLRHDEHYSRATLALFFVLSTGAVIVKYVIIRRSLRRIRRRGRNVKRVVLLGCGKSARRYLRAIETDTALGFRAVGYVAGEGADMPIPCLGSFDALETILERCQPDEVVSAIDREDYALTPHIVACCETAGVKLSIVPFYADYMPAHPQFDDVNGVPLMNIRRVPLENYGNAFMKRAMDIVGAAVMLLLLSPVMVICAAGVKLSSPGPILFRQTRVGLNKKEFQLLKFRSMRVNAGESSAWSRREDPRRTKFGAFLRKYSLDELPQLFCVLSGTMSLVGPRPEIPHFVDVFRGEIPLYMVRHQVRPGITGWAQIHGYRGDTPIRERVEHDIWYIENWNLLLDMEILLKTVFGGAFINDEA